MQRVSSVSCNIHKISFVCCLVWVPYRAIIALPFPSDLMDLWYGKIALCGFFLMTKEYIPSSRDCMSRRSKRGVIKKQAVLEQLKTGRNGAIQVCREAKINGTEYRAAGKAITAIDELTETLTGDKETLWLKGHKAG